MFEGGVEQISDGEGFVGRVTGSLIIQQLPRQRIAYHVIHKLPIVIIIRIDIWLLSFINDE